MWPKLVDVMNCIRKMNSYTTLFYFYFTDTNSQAETASESL